MTDAAGEVAGTSPRVSTAGISALPDATELNAYLADESRRATLPAGMRNNNPGNIKFVGQKVPGIVGPSVNTDQGDPQAVFDTPESGMRAMHSLLLKKYNGGKLTPNQIIAGNMGWTAGNFEAAANVARYAGIGPDDDIGLNDPTKAAKFMRGLMMQEHGKSSNLYPDSMILSALTNGAPTQVASLDPSAGMPPAVAAIEKAAPQSGYVDPMVSVQPNAAVPALSAPQTVSPAPAVASVPTQEVAQNGQYPTPPAPPSPPAPPQTPSQSPIMNEALLRAISSPYMTDGQRSVVQMLIQQQMQQQQQAREEQQWRARQDYQTQQQRTDPAYQLEQDYKREQLNALRNKTAKNWQKLDDNTLFNPDTGETMPVGAPASAGGKFRFEGKSVEAQALNGLMEAGQLTEGQAQQLGAGKTITGPNGEIIFMTPQGVFGKSADGTVSPMSAPQPQAPAGGVDIFGGAAPTAPAPPSPPQPPERTGMIPLTAPKVTVDESKAGGFADRMTQSGKSIDTYGNAGLNAFDQSITNSPYVPSFIANSLVGDDFQKYDQARRDFINAQLRRESGAVISPDEFDNANRQYFPQPGDKPEVLEQKRKSRETVINAMIRDAGPTYKKRGSSPELDAAREAIAKGAPRDAVIKRLRDNGIDPEGL
ncbi:hypothetical protein ASF03_21350 [Rhizobium sp. Leaf68]|nr:hypothetical protein ASF03_21350 [Rhizobium sp. Leaf68]